MTSLKKIWLIAAFTLGSTAALHAHETAETCPDCAGVGQIEEACNVCAGAGEYAQYNTSICNDCAGYGQLPGGSFCFACNGEGWFEEEVWVPCYACDGSGYEWSTCDTCNGTGIIWLWVAFTDAFRNVHYAEIGQRDVRVAC